MDAIKIRGKNEIRSFFSLTVMNLVIAAVLIVFGIGLVVPQLFSLLEL